MPDEMETEIKLDASHLSQPRELLQDAWLISLEIPGKRNTLVMDSRYYDTADSRLASSACSLRLRRENEQHILSLKGGGSVEKGLYRRAEWSVPLTAAEAGLFMLQPDIKKARHFLSDAWVACGMPGSSDRRIQDQPLTQIACVTFTRQLTYLRYRNTLVELALDQGTLSAALRTAPLCEIELELKQGDVADLIALGRELASRFSLKPQNASKLARCLALAAFRPMP